MLINLSNHPSSQWSIEQKVAATETYGGIMDVSFPKIDPNADSKQIMDLARDYAGKITHLASGEKGNSAVHVMGELTFCFAVVTLLQSERLTCVVSTSERNAIVSNGTKVSEFKFVSFRPYPILCKNNEYEPHHRL